MHGIGGGALNWKKDSYAAAVEKLAASGTTRQMTFVSFDTAPMSFFADRGGLEQGPRAFESWFIFEFIPMIEDKFKVCTVRACRSLLGVSMGGLGALKTALRHPDLFGAVAVNSGALPPFNVHEPWQNWRQYFNRHPVGELQGGALLFEARKIFSTWELSDQNDPSVLISQWKDLSNLPAIYLDVGGQDYFGFQEGFSRFAQAASARGAPTTLFFEPKEGHLLFHKRGIEAIRFLMTKNWRKQWNKF
jgi:S-formylglutathione hydrolase FrmB